MAVARSPHRAMRFVIAAMVSMAMYAAWIYTTPDRLRDDVATGDGRRGGPIVQPRGPSMMAGMPPVKNIVKPARAAAAPAVVVTSSPSPPPPPMRPPPESPNSPPTKPLGDDDETQPSDDSSGRDVVAGDRPPAHVAARCDLDDWPAGYQKLASASQTQTALDSSPRERRYFDGTLRACGCDASASKCHNFMRRYLTYAEYHRRVTVGDPTVSPGARILVVQNAWRTYGFGHMAPAAAGWILWGMASGRVVYFDNDNSEWNWLDYFRAYLPGGDESGTGLAEGLDTRWTPERAKEFEGRRRVWFKDQDEAVFDFEEFNWDEVDACVGTGGNCTEVMGCGRDKVRDGEECEPARVHGSCAMDTRDVWECDGCNTCLMDALRDKRRMRIVANSLRTPLFDEEREEIAEFSRAFWTQPAGWSADIHMYKQGPDVLKEFLENKEASHACRTCAMAMALRPDWRLVFWRDLVASSDTSRARRMYALKARTGYPEAAMCFPDDTSPTDACVDETWAHPPCAEFTAQWHIKNKAPDKSGPSGYLTPTNAVRALIAALDDTEAGGDGTSLQSRGFHDSWFRGDDPTAVVHVLTDAPALQDFLASRFPKHVRVTPGRGIDPTNNIRRDQDFGMESSRKIAIDMYVQAWADGETELGPSAYYFTGHELGSFAVSGYKRVGDVPSAPTRWDQDWYSADAPTRAARRADACTGGDAIDVTTTASGGARAKREGAEKVVSDDDDDEKGEAKKEETDSLNLKMDEDKARRLGAECAGASVTFEPRASVPDRAPLAVVDALRRSGVLANDKSLIEMNTLDGDLAACASVYVGRVEVSLPRDDAKGLPSRRACRGMRQRGLRVTCGHLLRLNAFEVPNVDVYLVRAGQSGGGKGGDSCGWHKLIEQLRKKLAQRLGGGTVSETPSDEQVVKYLGGKVVAVVALEGEEADAARRVVKEAGWLGWNSTEVAYAEGDANGTATVFTLPMDSPGVKAASC